MSQPINIDTQNETINLNSITKKFGDIIACENVDLNVHPNEFVVLLGPSGCGKTTTLRCIAGLENPDEGSITIGDEDVTMNKPKDRNLAFVFQSIALFPHMSVKENIRFGLDMNTDLSSQEKQERVQEVANILGIEKKLDRKPDELSGGQQQRVSLGRAMVMEPAAFLLDEPFSALDANLRDQMRVEIKELQRELQTAMIFVTHDQEEAMTLGDKIVILNDGRVQQMGSPYEIYNNPENQFVAEFIGSPSTNFIPCEVIENNGSFALESEIFVLNLTKSQSNTLAAEKGDNVSLAVRPDYLDLDTDGRLFDAEVTVVEPLGAHDAAYMSSNGINIRALTPQNKYKNGDSVSVGIDNDQIWVFNSDNNRVL